MSLSHVQPHYDKPRLVLPVSLVQWTLLWLMMAISWIVFIEPSPYELMFVVVLLAFLPNGLLAASALAPMIVFLLLYNIGGAFSLMNVSHSSKAQQFIIVSFYMGVSSIMFAMICAKAPLRAIAVIKNGYVLAAVAASLFGIIGYFNIAGTGEWFAVYGRAKSTFKDPNVFSTYLILPAAMLVHGLVDAALYVSKIAFVLFFPFGVVWALRDSLRRDPTPRLATVVTTP